MIVAKRKFTTVDDRSIKNELSHKWCEFGCKNNIIFYPHSTLAPTNNRWSYFKEELFYLNFLIIEQI